MNDTVNRKEIDQAKTVGTVGDTLVQVALANDGLLDAVDIKQPSKLSTVSTAAFSVNDPTAMTLAQ